MGHSMVSGPQGTLWMYGGLSLTEGMLGNVYRCEQLCSLNILICLLFLWLEGALRL